MEGQIKCFPHKVKAKGVHHHQAIITGNVKGTYLKKKKKIKSLNVKMAANSQLSTTKSKKASQANNENRNRTIDLEITWRVISWEKGGGDWGRRCRD